MDLSNINFIAVVVATFSAFLVGWLWYGPLFGRRWMAEVGFSEEDLQLGSVAKTFGLAFVFEFVMALNLALFFYGAGGGTQTVTGGTGAFYGFLAGFGWVFFALAVNSLHERKSWKYTFINGGYWVVTLTLMGFILGVWK